MRWSLAACAVLLCGCAVGPDYHPPKMATPASYSEIPRNAPFLAPNAGEGDLSAWWKGFGDAEMQSLIGRALKTNLDLQSAASRVRQAREQEIIAGATEYPQLRASSNAINLHSNGNPAAGLFGTGAGGSAPRRGTNVHLFSAGFDASWELDIFGGVRRGIEAARAGTEAARWQMRDGEVSLTAEIAAEYIALRAAQARLAVLQDEQQRQNSLLQLTVARRRTGFVTGFDVDQQATLLDTTTAGMAPLRAQIVVTEHALAVLLGDPPEALTQELAAPQPIPVLPMSLPVGLPSDLLRRRPDVRAAERRLGAATAQVGVAVAKLYPSFNLTALASFAGSNVGGLFSNKNLGELGLGMISWPVFQGGRIRARIRAKEESEQQAYLAYKEAVLGAVRDAADVIVRFDTDQQRLEALQKAEQSGSSAVQIATRQYRVGLATYVTVLTAETSYLSIVDQLDQSREVLADDLVSLYKAVGGGWSRDAEASLSRSISPGGDASPRSTGPDTPEMPSQPDQSAASPSSP